MTRRVASSVRPLVVATVILESEREVKAVASSTTASWLGVGPHVPIGSARPLRSITNATHSTPAGSPRNESVIAVPHAIVASETVPLAPLAADCIR